MNTKQITVKYINQPKTERGPGSVKDNQGVYWKVWRDQLATFREGGTYTVGYTTEMYQGKEQYTVKEVQEVTGQVLTAPSIAPTPKPHTNGDNRDEHIFVCGIVNNAVAAGKIDPMSAADIAECTKAASSAYKAWRAA